MPSPYQLIFRPHDPADSASWPAFSKRAVDAGFSGIEVCLPPGQGETNFKCFGELRVSAASWTCGLMDIAAARAEVSYRLTHSAILGARCLTLTLPPLRLRQADIGFNHYQDALNFTYELLRETSFQAESSGVALALEAPAGGLFLSPVELRELIDSIHSSAVGVCVDVNRILPIGSHADWFQTLSYRIHAVRCSIEGMADSSAPFTINRPTAYKVLAANLKAIAYDRLVILAGSGDPQTRRDQANLSCGL